MFDKLLGGAFDPKMMIDMMARFMSPGQRAMIELLPKVVPKVYDISKRPAPTQTIIRRGSKVYVQYDFATEDDAKAFEEAERDTLATIDLIVKEIARKQAEVGKDAKHD